MGSLGAGDVRVCEVSGGAPPEPILWILARLRYQTRLASSSVAGAAIMVKRNDEKLAVRLPDSEDMWVFLGSIVFLLQEVNVKVKGGNSQPM